MELGSPEARHLCEQLSIIADELDDAAEACVARLTKQSHKLRSWSRRIRNIQDFILSELDQPDAQINNEVLGKASRFAKTLVASAMVSFAAISGLADAPQALSHAYEAAETVHEMIEDVTGSKLDLSPIRSAEPETTDREKMVNEFKFLRPQEQVTAFRKLNSEEQALVFAALREMRLFRELPIVEQRDLLIGISRHPGLLPRGSEADIGSDVIAHTLWKLATHEKVSLIRGMRIDEAAYLLHLSGEEDSVAIFSKLSARRQKGILKRTFDEELKKRLAVVAFGGSGSGS